MLTHHELATLLRLRDAERRLEELDPEVLALSRYELVEISRRDDDDMSTLKLTGLGRELARRLGGGSGDV
ncbi:hypothetical protein [Paraburkholderia metrosideri]|jgi:hypothetical protein|uniref:Preprotein translocase subunit SecA n=1 Tax=Paraburkholderia metrosideri TaxID=580937 RepID=A0ABN7HSN0_9BURK|nr:hypothetical protein [Paraburkholderia metrosideri]CAD6530925.1 hypothetical protein LMG28140_02423 [Paraburkholderia metrosideri]